MNTDCSSDSRSWDRWRGYSTGGQGVYGDCAQTGSRWTSHGNPMNPYDSNAECNRDKRLYCVWYDGEIPSEWGHLQP